MNLPTGITQALGKNSLALQQASPKLLFVGGVAGVVGSTVLACRATLKLSDTLEQTAENLELAKGISDEKYEEAGESRQKDITIITIRGGINVAKLYAPAIILGGLSIAALTKSHTMLTERNAALAAAFTAVDNAFTKYRQKVVENYGEDVDRNLRYEVEEIEVENSKGKKQIQQHAGPGSDTVYARFFDPLCESWGRDPEMNLYFLRTQQTWFNDQLRTRGYVFLNEVYRALGIPETKAGQVVGWTLEGDGYIDFGMFDASNHKARDFVNGREGSILLDFNVDGVIVNKIEEIVEERS